MRINDRPGRAFCHLCDGENVEAVKGEEDRLYCRDCERVDHDIGWRRFRTPRGGETTVLLPRGARQIEAADAANFEFERTSPSRVLLAAADDEHPKFRGTRTGDRAGAMFCAGCGSRDLSPVDADTGQFQCDGCGQDIVDEGLRKIVLASGRVFTFLAPRGSVHVPGAGRRPDVLRIPGEPPLVLASGEETEADEAVDAEDSE